MRKILWRKHIIIILMALTTVVLMFAASPNGIARVDRGIHFSVAWQIGLAVVFVAQEVRSGLRESHFLLCHPPHLGVPHRICPDVGVGKFRFAFVQAQNGLPVASLVIARSAHLSLAEWRKLRLKLPAASYGLHVANAYRDISLSQAIAALANLISYDSEFLSPVSTSSIYVQAWLDNVLWVLGLVGLLGSFVLCMSTLRHVVIALVRRRQLIRKAV